MGLTLAACGGPGTGQTLEQATVAMDAGVRTSGCASDADCGDGMLCESCGDGFMSCVPGCRTDAQCGANMLCSHNVQCLSCPCPSGWCDLDPCRDLDGDGFAAALTGLCPGKTVGDCDDASPLIHPGAIERCANGRDDDCDGRTDFRDDGCRDTCPNSNFCGASINCGSSRFCEQGCCEECPTVNTPICAANECLLPGGLDVKGCEVAPVCGACMSCTADFEPVCGKNFATYSNACLAQAAGTSVLHSGECDYREGSTCLSRQDCASTEVCRNVSGVMRCARVGTCSVDADCDAITSVVSCGDAGIADWVCRDERCAAQCP